ncbi:DUF452 family protein [Aggregatibacter actinomycetemcomitans]|uniref:DUF452 family protein n=1 Tax=Aggregatibacter actinomycetemcomitans TaxID=714 RepID=UPI0011DB5DBD|nr:pimeloyl-ACP methyl esterase BioG family protein [Aggregatibacter actinomycetemcomitans]TYA49648.1 DUF452 family protein [Aggregatibacter actinomycetemcomitans]
MQYQLINVNLTRRHLIVYFTGWGMTPLVIQHLTLPKEHDLLICYDYRDLSLNFDFSCYESVHLVAWSMGVWVAEHVMGQTPLLSATAINGTGLPMHDEYGIPCAVFKGTLEAFDEVNQHKFERRMCGDKSTLLQYQSLEGRRSIEETHAELTALYEALLTNRQNVPLHWTKAIIGTQDRIFPVQNQRNYWHSRCTMVEMLGGHYLFPLLQTWAQLW